MSRYCQGVRLCEECSRNVGLAVRARKDRLAPKRAPREEREAAESLADVERSVQLRAAVFRRDETRCQLCDDPHVNEGLDPHHMEMGGTKTKRERLSNVLVAHRTCHEAYHANERAFVPRVVAWCQRHGYPLPNRRAFR